MANDNIVDLFKSKGEKQIAHFLDESDIRYQYEKGLLIDDHGKQRIWYPDFWLPEFSIIIEYFGMEGDKSYYRGIDKKEDTYSKMNIPLIDVYPYMLRGDYNWKSNILAGINETLVNRMRIFEDKFAGRAVNENCLYYK